MIIKEKLSTSSNDIFVSYVSSIINRWFHEVNICLISWPLGFRLAPGTASLQASPVFKKVGGMPSWWVQLDSPGTA